MHTLGLREFSRNDLLNLLNTYRCKCPDRVPVVERVIQFVEREPACAKRSTSYGHLTGSAWVVNQTRARALLVHHKKLGRWLQPGGHADGELNLLSVALREASEESGLQELTPVATDIFDIDIHEIPEWNGTPSHLHFDVRFMLQGNDGEPVVCSSESNLVRWVPLSEVASLTNEESVLRMVRSTQAAAT